MLTEYNVYYRSPYYGTLYETKISFKIINTYSQPSQNESYSYTHRKLSKPFANLTS